MLLQKPVILGKIICKMRVKYLSLQKYKKIGGRKSALNLLKEVQHFRLVTCSLLMSKLVFVFPEESFSLQCFN